MSIPKIIHYIQFEEQMKDQKQLQKEEKCMKTWKDKLNGHEFVKWSSENFDIAACPYTNACLQINRWDLIENYIKAYALKEQGGIFFSNEIMVLDQFDDLLDFHMFFGFEHSTHISNTVVAAEKDNKFCIEFVDHLDKLIGSKEGMTLEYEGYLTTVLKEKYHLLFNNQEQLLEGNIKVYSNETFINPSINSKTILINAENCNGKNNSFWNRMDQNKRMKIQNKEQAEKYRKKQENKISLL